MSKEPVPNSVGIVKAQSMRFEAPIVLSSGAQIADYELRCDFRVAEGGPPVGVLHGKDAPASAQVTITVTPGVALENAATRLASVSGSRVPAKVAEIIGRPSMSPPRIVVTRVSPGWLR